MRPFFIGMKKKNAGFGVPLCVLIRLFDQAFEATAALYAACASV